MKRWLNGDNIDPISTSEENKDDNKEEVKEVVKDTKKTKMDLSMSIKSLMQIRQRGDLAACNTLNHLHAHPFDLRIKFDEGPHIYTVDGEQMPISVSGLVGAFHKPFDSEELLQNIFYKAKGQDSRTYRIPYSKTSTSSNKFAGLTIYETAKLWKHQNQAGTDFHACVEYFFDKLGTTHYSDMTNTEKVKHFRSCPNYNDVDNKTTSEQFFRAMEAFHREGWQLYRYEWNVFWEEYEFCGGVDAVFKRRTFNGIDEFAIVDWKRSSSDYTKVYGKGTLRKLFYPLEDVKDNKFECYSLQVSFYAAILHYKYGFNVTKAYFVQFHPEQATHILHTVNLNLAKTMHLIQIWKNHRDLHKKYTEFIKGSKGTSGPLTRTSLIHPEYPKPLYISAKVNQG